MKARRPSAENHLEHPWCTAIQVGQIVIWDSSRADVGSSFRVLKVPRHTRIITIAVEHEAYRVVSLMTRAMHRGLSKAVALWPTRHIHACRRPGSRERPGSQIVMPGFSSSCLTRESSLTQKFDTRSGFVTLWSDHNEFLVE